MMKEGKFAALFVLILELLMDFNGVTMTATILLRFPPQALYRSHVTKVPKLTRYSHFTSIKEGFSIEYRKV